jgi:hypothetical protein
MSLHRPILALLFFVFAAGVHADPATDLEAAIRALLAERNFAWRVTLQLEAAHLEAPSPGRIFSYEGVSARGGYTVVHTTPRNIFVVNDPFGERNASERPTEIVFLGEGCVLRLEVNQPWLTPREYLPPRPWGTAIVGEAIRQGTGGGQTATVAGARTRLGGSQEGGTIEVPRPDLMLAGLLGQFVQAKETRRAIDVELNERAVVRLFEQRLAVPGVNPRTTSGKTVQIKDGVGTGSFWIVDGLIAKFELVLESILKTGPLGPAPTKVTITAIINDPGTTTVDAPPGARARLER